MRVITASVLIPHCNSLQNKLTRINLKDSSEEIQRIGSKPNYHYFWMAIYLNLIFWPEALWKYQLLLQWKQSQLRTLLMTTLLVQEVPQNKKKQAEVAGNQHSLAETCWANWKKRRASKGNGSKDMSPGRNTGMLPRWAEMRLRKPRNRWNWTWWRRLKTPRRDFIDTFVWRDRSKRILW